LFLAELAPDANSDDAAARARRVNYRIQFVRIVTDQRQYVGISLPRLLSIDESVAHTLAHHARHHYVAALAVYAATSALPADESAAREPAAAHLVALLWRHDNDARLAGGTRRAHVASLYFPLLPALLDAFDRLQRNATRRELALWLAAMLWLLRNLRTAALQQWLLRETQTRRRRLFDAMLLAIALFDPTADHAVGDARAARRRHSDEIAAPPRSPVDVELDAAINARAAPRSKPASSPRRLSRRRRSNSLGDVVAAAFAPSEASTQPFIDRYFLECGISDFQSFC
jgi:hypothetical protein